MKLKTLNIALLIAAGFLFQGCTKDFLNVPSKEIVEADDSNEVYQPETFINGVYGMFTDWNYGFAYLGITEIISDNADKGSSATDTGTDKDILDALTYTSTTPSFASTWEHWYKSIGRATQAIEYTENFGLTDEVYKNRLIGEARFLRALNYFFLVRGWGDVTIQDVDLIQRQSTAAVYAYIEADLQFAIEHLPLKSAYEAKDLGRATKGAAQGLLAKVFLYQSKWQDAVNMAQTVLNSGEYSLEPDYATIWRATTDNGRESLFEFQARGEEIAHGIQQYSQTQGARGESGWGWGFNIPSQNLLDAFNAEGDEIRKNATIIFPGETLWDGRRVSPNVENPMYNEKAYSSANAGAGDTDKNIRYLRLGEIYLILAEAANETGNSQLALQNLNIIRSRVNLPAVTVTDQVQLRQAIWKERRLELAFEHDRWFDLVRTRQGEAAMRAAGKNFQERNYIFPIPDRQLIQTPEMTQNTGW
ncbi:RagB/SusD family nutrient uptake outer membrane protein [Sphingobacterium paludis]|jgi:starch-binding outer membrane protein, SusD/RagB family|uniref:Putative outer membrane starch-binding protein n=1 Tax=Sphingobacterium paludis TaxID=1476465 RepID=A0A4R7DEA3_9SPHI|nr:RagB/SusD family nutrient uptake outer membrane protein [Sphingobacterium paludis]TDS17506.1 putative outer membrane starch-binding protein [Sphingobacterium paludis]